MRRDYFTCVFLGCICAALFFVYFTPAYFVYGGVSVRTFSLTETICAWVYAAIVLLILPIYAAYKKKLWITAGLMAYGAFASLPIWIMPKLMSKLQGEDASIVATVEAFLLKALYRMATAPFGAISRALGDKFTRSLPFRILPVAVLVYVGFQLFRFYRNAYVMEQLSPATAIDMTAKENAQSSDSRKVRDARIPEVLGTVISAPAGASGSPAKKPDPAQASARRPQPQARQQVSSETIRIPHVPVRESRAPEVDDKTKPIRLGPPPTKSNSEVDDSTKAIPLPGPKGSPSGDDDPGVIHLGPPPRR